MRIDQDTYKDGRLDFGMLGSPHRDAVWEWRWTSFRSLFIEKYPEMVLVLCNIKSQKDYRIINNIFTLTFKYSDKLGYGLRYQDMETITQSEFKKILKRFSRYLQCSQEISKIKGLLTD